MKKNAFLFIISTILIVIAGESCNQKRSTPGYKGSYIPFDSTLITPFFEAYPVLKKYETEMVALYRNFNFNYIWFDKKGVTEYGSSLYSNVKDLEEEGIALIFPYQKNIEEIFEEKIDAVGENTNAEFLLSGLYLFYIDKVYKGIDHKTTTNLGWLLPRKMVSYTGLLDSVLSDQKSPNEDSLPLMSQYYRLRDVLKQYRSIEQKGGWKLIDINPEIKAYKPNDTARAIRQIRERLFLTGDITQNNGSNLYDYEMVAAIQKFQLRNGFNKDTLILPEHIQAMNTPVGERIKTIVVNMERCRWVSPEIFHASEFVFVNIPSYEINYIRDGNTEFNSPVVVGESMTKTVIFSGKMSYIVFSPWWNLPKSIIEKEVIPGIEKNKNYLKSHNMEWNDGQVRQKPGKNNSLGLVKFIFPNSNDIYFHDTPAKSLFEKEDRSLSHGCIRVKNAHELAYKILQDDDKWTPGKIDAAMKSGKEKVAGLEDKIPVHIGYFTAWVNDQGQVSFYKDVYDRDERLAALLFYKE
ncbi:MAG: L,D-transpeptidase family protein [Lentimicrobium sp.]|nr:L,D-transpeptidase family protein [Lentimicrobium sp.]